MRVVVDRFLTEPTSGCTSLQFLDGSTRFIPPLRAALMETGICFRSIPSRRKVLPMNPNTDGTIAAGAVPLGRAVSTPTAGPLLALWYLVAAGAFLSVAVLAWWSGVTVPAVTRDPSSITGGHPLQGVLSTIGLFGWASAASICFFTAVSLPDGNLPMRRFFIVSGLLSAYLLCDDAFLIHDFIVPRYLGIDGSFVVLLTAVAAAAYTVHYRAVLFSAGPLLFLPPLLCLALSAGVDFAFAAFGMTIDMNLEFLVEDGLKFLGIAGWIGFFVVFARSTLVHEGNRSEVSAAARV
jgi:hypothetical protein